jgi:hypothetical protein
LADFAITISNNLITVGYDPTSRWGTLIWGTDSWRFNGETLQNVEKAIDFGDATPSDATIKDLEHLLDFGSTPLSETITKSFARSYSNTVGTDFEISNAFLTDKNGYYYVFIGGVIDADDRTDPVWAKVTDEDSTWTAITAIDSTWS